MQEARKKVNIPYNSIIVKRDSIVEKASNALILDISGPKKPNTGVIVYAGQDLWTEVGRKVCFREEFTDDISEKCADLRIGKEELLFIRDYTHAIYYTEVDE